MKWIRGQHGNTILLVLNNVAGAATGLLFWLLLARVAHVDAHGIGVGMAIVSLGTAIGLVSLAGFDAALIRHIPTASSTEGRRMLGFAIAAGAVAALLWSLAAGAADGWTGQMPEIDALGWALVGTIAVLLVATWLQDAYYMAYGDAAATLKRNLSFAAARLALPLPIVLLALPQPVSSAWAIALVVSMVVGIWYVLRRPAHVGGRIDRKAFMRSARRNITGNAAQFLPGLLLVPLVLATAGDASAGFFGMAWTAASLLFLAAAAIGRSAFSELVRDTAATRVVLRRATLQVVVILLPAMAVGIALARPAMWIFGPEYVAGAAPAFAILCLSILFVAPIYLYLALLRAREDRPRTLVVLPLLLMAVLFGLAPAATQAWGVQGAALAWFAANAPFGVFAAWRLLRHSKEVNDASSTVRGHPHPE